MGWQRGGESAFESHERCWIYEFSANAKVISVTAGGDDDPLVSIAASCIFRQWVLAPGRCRPDPTLSQRFPNERSGLDQMFAAIREKAPDAKIYILGYPDPLPQSFTPGNCPALENLIAPGLQTGIVNDDLDYLNSIITHINTVVQAAANADGATYIAPDPAFTKHDVCSADPWFFPLSLQIPNPEVLHPNQAGHRMMEQELFNQAGPAPD